MFENLGDRPAVLSRTTVPSGRGDLVHGARQVSPPVVERLDKFRDTRMHDLMLSRTCR